MTDSTIKHRRHPNEAAGMPPALDFSGISKDLHALRERMPLSKWRIGGGKRSPLRDAILKMRGQLLAQ